MERNNETLKQKGVVFTWDHMPIFTDNVLLGVTYRVESLAPSGLKDSRKKDQLQQLLHPLAGCCQKTSTQTL